MMNRMMRVNVHSLTMPPIRRQGGLEILGASMSAAASL
jgi:hypothetical protein